MSPEDELCQRVLQLSGSPIVPPAISVRLGQAVARYRRETEPLSDLAFARVLGLGTIGGILAIGGLAGMRYVHRAGSASWAHAGWVCLGALAAATGAGLMFLAGWRLQRERLTR